MSVRVRRSTAVERSSFCSRRVGAGLGAARERGRVRVSRVLAARKGSSGWPSCSAVSPCRGCRERGGVAVALDPTLVAHADAVMIAEGHVVARAVALLGFFATPLRGRSRNQHSGRGAPPGGRNSCSTPQTQSFVDSFPTDSGFRDCCLQRALRAPPAATGSFRP